MPELVKKDKIKAKVSDKSDKTSNTSSKTKSKPDSESYDPILGPKDRNYFLKYPQSIWYEQAKELPKLDSNEVVDDTDFILEMKAKARDLYEKLASEFEEARSRKTRSDEGWMNTVLKSGTMSDKMAAMILLVQAAPLYRIKTLHMLLNQAAKHGRRESLMALDTLKDLFMTNLLPSDRKLIAYHHRPLKASNLTDMHHVYWYYEDLLKSVYTEFISSLNKASHDSILHTKKKSQMLAFDLLCEKPEQEQALLSLIVNKLGDPEKKIASNSTHLLNVLLKRHPGMKMVVARELETFLHRTSISPRAQYYGIIFLNQILLSEDQVDLSKKLLTIYFSMFKKLTDVKKDIESRMLSALLTGVNRAFPFAPLDRDNFSDQLDMLFKIVHIASFNKSTQALQLIYQLMFAQQNITDRFYRALYQQLCSPELTSSSRQGLFLNVLFKSMKNDTQITRVCAFVKRLLQVSLLQNPGFVCGALYLVSEMVKLKPELKKMFTKPLNVSKELKELSSQVLMHLTNDMNFKPTTALAQIASALDGAKMQSGKIIFGGKERIGKDSKLKNAENNEQNKASTGSSEANTAEQTESKPVVVKPNQLSELTLESYDPSARDPLYCHADTTVWWELVNLSKHIHPSVAKWANLILSEDSIDYSGDPLQDFGLHAFLDRIIYKNPKQVKEGEKKDSASTNVLAKQSFIPMERMIPANSATFLQQSEDDVPEDQLFFYKYFQQKETINSQKKQKKKKADEDEDEFDFDGDQADIDDFSDDDFADEFDDGLDEKEVEKALLGSKAGKKDKSKSKEGDMDVDDDDEGDFSYDDLKEEDFDDEEETGLAMDSFLNNLATEASDDEEGGILDNVDFMSDPKKKNKKQQLERPSSKAKSAFADVEEFQHLLETSGSMFENKWDKERAKAKKTSKKRKEPTGGFRAKNQNNKKKFK